MREHEIDLIAALVEGRLEDDSEARALIASSPALREEYEAQKLAYQALAGAEAAMMTESERAALHRDVWSAWRAPSSPTTSRVPWLYRWASVAAGLFVVVGLVAVLDPGGEVQETFSEIGSSLDGADVTTTAAATAEGEVDSAGGGDSGAEAPSDGETLSEEDLSRALTPTEESYLSSEIAKVRAGDTGTIAMGDGDEPDLEECLREAGFEGFRALATLPPPADRAEGTDEEQAPPEQAPLIVATPEGGDPSEALVVVVEQAGCELVYFDD